MREAAKWLRDYFFRNRKYNDPLLLESSHVANHPPPEWTPWQLVGLERVPHCLPANPCPASRLFAAGGVLDLEDRVMPATFTVTNIGDNGGGNPAPNAGTGTLRQAIIDANANPGADTIVFSDGSNSSTNFNIGVNTIALAAALPAFKSSGGTIAIQGSGANHLTLTSSFDGQAISDSGGSSLTISGVKLSGFHNTDAGGLATLTTPVNWEFDNCLITGCTAGTYGGGVFYLEGGTFSGNNQHLTFKNCTISGNTATMGSGGFLYSYEAIGIVVTFSQCTLTQNSATGGLNGFDPGGGALAFYGASGTVNISDSTIADNAVANSGGAIGFNLGSGNTMMFNLTNDIISQNKVGTSTTSANADLGTTSGTAIWNVNYCAIGTAKGTVPGVTLNGGNNILDADLQLPVSPMLANNGGTMPTILPAKTSPIVDAGPPGAGSPTATDQRGGLRVVDRIDIGSVEVGSAAIPSAWLVAAPTVTQPSPGGFDAYQFTVGVRGNAAHPISSASVESAANKANAIVVISTNPAYSGTAHWVSDDSGGANQAVITAVYQLDNLPDNGSPNAWSGADDGTYSVSVSATSTIGNMGGIAIPSGAIGAFAVNAHQYIVTNTSDSGPGSLRQAILNANANPGSDTITFSDGSNGSTNFDIGVNTITLASALPTFTAAGGLTVSGTGANHISLTSSFSGHLLNDAGGSALTMSGVTLSGFHNAGATGGLATLAAAVKWEFDNCVISGYTASGGGVFYLQSGSGNN